MRVGFFNNQLDNRGTGNAVFEYAYYNEKLLGNKSFIYTYKKANHNVGAYLKFSKYFPIIFDPFPDTKAVDVMYHIKSGEDDGVRFPNTRYVVHAVFNAQQRHGDRYAAISEWLGDRDKVPWVPHIVDLPYYSTTFREYLKIPEEATVFGRYGGSDTFDISWVWEAIKFIVTKRKDVFFIFMNTDKPEDMNHPQVKFLPEVIDVSQKRQFINTCDAMLHARSRGETFGLAVGEFAFCGKPVFTYANSYEKSHLNELSRLGYDKYFYRTYAELCEMLSEFKCGEKAFAYTQYYPEQVMERFKKVFLDD